MPAGKHTSVRVALAIPPKIHEQLSEWAESEGRPVASLCMYLVESGLRQAQREGIAPSMGESDRYEPVSMEISEKGTEAMEKLGFRKVSSRKNTASMNDKEFEEYYMEQYKDLTPSEEPSGADAARMAAIRASQGVGKQLEGDELTKAMEEYGGQQVSRRVVSKKEQLLEKLLSALTE